MPALVVQQLLFTAGLPGKSRLAVVLMKTKKNVAKLKENAMKERYENSVI